MMLATALPGMCVGLVAGVLVDRFDRKRIMIVASLIERRAGRGHSARAAARGRLAVRHRRALERAGQFFAPAQASLLPETAPDEELAAANAMMSISQFGALTVGYAAAGLIATLASIDWAFYLDALSFLLSALCILLVRVAPLADVTETTLAAVADSLRGGLGLVRHTPVLRSLVGVYGPIFVAYGFSNALFLPFAMRALGATEFEYSLLEGVFTVGFVAGSLAMAGLADRLHAGQWIAVSILGMALFTACVALSGSVPVAIAATAMIGLVNAPSYAGSTLLIQRNTPREARGRVSSVFFVTRNAGYLVGMAAAGLADIVDVRVLLLANAAVLLGCGVAALMVPGLRQERAEWRRIVAMLRTSPSGSGLGLGRAALVADIEHLAVHLPVLAGVPREVRQQLAAEARVHEVPAGMVIVRQGEQSDAAYFLLEGRTVASRVEGEEVGRGRAGDTGASERVLEIHSAGDFFGEIAALTGMPRTATVLAEEPTSVLQVPAAALRGLMKDPHVGRTLLGKLTERMFRMSLVELPRFAGLDQATMVELRTP